MKHRYGITVAEYDILLEKQKGVCAICGQPEKLKGRINLSVDHCHETKVVRGLLCDGCNKGLGHFKDDVDLLENAKQYLWSKTH